MLLGFLLPYVSRVGNGPWMPSLMFKVLLAVTSGIQSQHQAPFWVILGLSLGIGNQVSTLVEEIHRLVNSNQIK